MKMSKYTQAEQEQILSELLDPKRITVMCGLHSYIPARGTIPTEGCKQCWIAYYIDQMAQTPPHLREQRLEELESLVSKMVELKEQGKFDINLFERPTIEKAPN